jgi:DNA-binding response OmpR family regulator
MNSNSHRILVVDDEPSIRTLLVKLFANAGYTAEAAASAEEALHVQQSRPADVLFLDLNLPGTNGLELCREVRKHWPWSIPIAITGFASLYELVACREAGFEDYFVKPFVFEELWAAAAHGFAKVDRWKQR